MILDSLNKKLPNVISGGDLIGESIDAGHHNTVASRTDPNTPCISFLQIPHVLKPPSSPVPSPSVPKSANPAAYSSMAFTHEDSCHWRRPKEGNNEFETCRSVSSLRHHIPDQMMMLALGPSFVEGPTPLSHRPTPNIGSMA